MKNSLLSAEYIIKTFVSGDTKLEVLKGVSFTIRHGEIAVLTGASGSGKSTLLNILAGIETLDSGKVYLEEEDLTSLADKSMAERRNRDIGFVFQFHHLLEDFTVLENVMMPALILGTERGLARRKALELLEEVGLENRSGHKPAEISGGEAQRVAVARALVNEPKMILADEPTGNLDRANGEKLVELLSKLNREHRASFLIATHNEELLEGSRRFKLIDGKIIEN
ncbi:MAG: ATP-binding cassette domain-containing protein [candidate division Zixibacteria bacterium]|nr:ATP-binding cassette domain-containing protein [candidate division Zixibacteria bacterium]